MSLGGRALDVLTDHLCRDFPIASTPGSYHVETGDVVTHAGEHQEVGEVRMTRKQKTEIYRGFIGQELYSSPGS